MGEAAMKTRWIVLVLLLLLIGPLAAPARAMQSADCKLEWFTPLTGSGGFMTSPSARLHLTVGQAVIGAQSGAAASECLGFWCSAGGEYLIMLPLITR
jgi:hypothetical protein